MTVHVERVAARVTFPLRQQVLRPHQTLEQLALPGDDDADSAHFVAVDEAVVGTASVRRERPPWTTESVACWRLRGMATAEDRRNEGIGAAVLAAVVDHVAGQGGGLLWCQARVPALSFYLRAGFATRGDRWLDPVIGPHVAMEMLVGQQPADPRLPSRQ